jgi:hypothetical protein
MTRKHFIELADVIRAHNSIATDYAKSGEGEHFQPISIEGIESLAAFCARQNPGFNREWWLGYIAGTNGKNGGKVK